MRAPAFWWREAGLAAHLLAPAAAAYGAVSGARMQRHGIRAAVPVVCVGDFTLGGAGKTPAAIMLASMLADRAPAFLTRGYGGRLHGPLRVDPAGQTAAAHTAAAVGDEALLLARHCPTIVARDRVAGARAACAAGAGLLVMDDGFQNPALAKDLSLVVVDAARGLGNGRVFPAGPLRAPLSTQLARADGLILVGEGAAGDRVAAAARAAGKPVFAASIEADGATIGGLRGRPLLAFAGIGHPEKFFATLMEAGLIVPARRAFGDHHVLTRGEAEDLLREADRAGLTLVTTEKDYVRLGDASSGPVAALRERATPLPIVLHPAEPERLRDFILGRLASWRAGDRGEAAPAPPPDSHRLPAGPRSSSATPRAGSAPP